MSETISDKIASVLSAAPSFPDPEDDVAYEETTAKVARGKTTQDEAPTGAFRKQNLQLLEDIDERYKGTKSSRNELAAADDWDEDYYSDEGVIDEEASSESELSDVSGPIQDEIQAEEKKFKHFESASNNLEIMKGKCVKNQLRAWENLLEIRIQLQKLLLASNGVPQISGVKNGHGSGIQTKTKQGVGKLLNKLLLLQELLVGRYSETKNVFSEVGPNLTLNERLGSGDEEITSDSEDEGEDEEAPPQKKRRKIGDYAEELSKRHESYRNYRNSVIKKWDAKTRFSANKPNAHSVMEQIEHVLGDKSRLLKKTQLVVGKEETYDGNSFNDGDFYHRLLRELIECRSGDVSDPVQLGRQWIQLQNLRSKMKRSIDTKATKGRKIRYALHSKLVNFMAPMEENRWTDEAKTELYSSLFGRNRP